MKYGISGSTGHPFPEPNTPLHPITKVLVQDYSHYISLDAWNFNRNCTQLHIDERGQLWMEFFLPKDLKKTGGLFAPNCQAVCRARIRRWHLTCLWGCKIRRWLRGEIPTLARIDPLVMIAVWGDRPGYMWKSPLMKHIFSLLETLTC